MARQRYRAAEWAAFIDEWNASDLKLPEFCRQRGLNPGTMQGWVDKSALKPSIDHTRRNGQVKEAKTAHEVAPAAPPPVFVPVRFAEAVAPTPVPTNRGAIEIVLGRRRRVVVLPGFDAETLRRVVAALEG